MIVTWTFASTQGVQEVGERFRGADTDSLRRKRAGVHRSVPIEQLVWRVELRLTHRLKWLKSFGKSRPVL